MSEKQVTSIMQTDAELELLLHILTSGLEKYTIGVDYETTDTKIHDAHIVGVGLYIKESQWKIYIPFNHVLEVTTETTEPKMFRGKWENAKGIPYTKQVKQTLSWEKSPRADNANIKYLGKLLTALFHGGHTLYAHNMKFEYGMAKRVVPEIEATSKLHCSLIMHWLAKSQFGVEHGLKSIMKTEFGIDMTTYNEVTEGCPSRQIAYADIQKTADYCSDDAQNCLILGEHYLQVLEKDGLTKVYESLELPVMDMLVDMENTGIQIDTTKLAEIITEFEAEELTLRTEINSLLELEPEDLDSDHKMREILFEKYKFPVKPRAKKTKTGKLKLDTEAIEYWLEFDKNSLEYQFADLRLRWGVLDKLISTYGRNLIKQVSSDGRLRAHVNQTGTETGRFSMSEPNLQNIPARSKVGKRIREAFVAKPGYKLVVCDYSQLEPRITAHLSKDTALIKAYNEGKDIYLFLAELLKDKGITVTRDDSKTLVLGMNYGLSTMSLASKIDMSTDQAEEVYEKFFEVCSGVAAWKKWVVTEAEKTGYIKTFCGRRRYLPDIKIVKPTNRYEEIAKARASRQAVNAIIQGSAADIVKLAMRNIHRSLKGKDAKLLLQVHDEIIAEAKEEIAEEIGKIMKDHMQTVVNLKVPLTTEPKIIVNWSLSK